MSNQLSGQALLIRLDQRIEELNDHRLEWAAKPVGEHSEDFINEMMMKFLHRCDEAQTIRALVEDMVGVTR